MEYVIDDIPQPDERTPPVEKRPRRLTLKYPLIGVGASVLGLLSVLALLISEMVAYLVFNISGPVLDPLVPIGLWVLKLSLGCGAVSVVWLVLAGIMEAVRWWWVEA